MRIKLNLSAAGLAVGLGLFSSALWPATGLAQPVTFGSAGPINFTNGVAVAVPYPSLIYVGTNGAASLPGTIQTVTVTLNNFNCKVPKDVSVLVEAPNGTAFEIMSGAGGTTSFSPGPGNLTISDSASSVMPMSAFGTGTYKPTVYPCGDIYPPPAPIVYSSAPPCGTSTFASEFGGLNPNGTWQLFLANQSLGASGSASAWSLGFTVNPPALSVTCSHIGDFCQGEAGAQYSVVVANAGPGSTGGSVPATVVDTLPAGLTPTDAEGAGWNFVISGQTVTCTTANQTPAGTSYPTITLTVNVAANTPASLVNSVTLTGSSDGTHTTDDTTTVDPLNSTITPSPANPFPNSSGNQASAPAGASSYSWTITNGVITSANNLQTITYTAGLFGSVGLTILISNAGGCTADNSVSVPLSGIAQVQLIDVNFNTNSLFSTGGGVIHGPAMSGAAVLGQAGDQWNDIQVSSGTGIPLIYANGSNSPMTMTFTSAGGYNVYGFSGTTPFKGTPYEALMENYLYNGRLGTFAPQTITLSGLPTNSMCNLVLYSAADTAGAGRTTLFTVNGKTLTNTWNASSSTFIAGTDYVEFASALSDGSGNLAITWNGNGTAEGDVNGFQIQVTNQIQITIPPNVIVDWNDVHQRIDGFGASSAFTGFTWTTAQADMFFSTSSGIGLSLLRSQIQPGGFATATEIGLMQMAQARGVTIWSSPWSPQASFKDNNSVISGDFVSANNQAYANQLAGYAATMKNTYGVNIYAISIQNEPDEAASYTSCLWTDQQIHDFVPYLYGALAASNVATTKIMLPEDIHWRTNYYLTAMSDPPVAAEVGIIANHNYDGANFQTGATTPPAALPAYGKSLWETEVGTGDPYDGSISNAIYWAGRIHQFMTLAQANAWHYWWLISLNPDNEGLTDTAGNPAKRMYALGQFSRFLRPGYYQIGVNTSIPALISAYHDSSSPGFAIVAINTNSFDLTNEIFALTNFPSANFVTPWVTSSNLSLASQPSVAVANSEFVYTLPAMSIVTFVSPPAPQLGINRTGPGSAKIFWPNTWNFVLQTNKNLTSSSWSNFNSSITTSNGTNSITITPPKGNLFFRLIQ
jgi:glucuronoarabinoxylan endo-1,4-beta-xylanase